MICQGTIEMLRSLTEDFIDFTRFENEKGLPIKKESVNIREFFNDIDNIFSFQAEEKDLRFDINMSPDVPDTIYTDPKRLKQVVLNLLSNSFKFTQRGKIEINLLVKKGVVQRRKKHFNDDPDYDPSKSLIKGSLIDANVYIDRSVLLRKGHKENFLTEEEDQRRYLFIEVVDTGLGMDEKDRRELFTKFGTGKNSRGLNTNGLGLGLYLSKEICLKMNGDITCESIAGIGSTFIIKLPFDSRYELKELLENDSLLFKSPSAHHKRKNFANIEAHDFDEFINAETKDSLLDAIDINYNLKLSRNCFNLLRTISGSKVCSDGSRSLEKKPKPEVPETNNGLEKKVNDPKFELDLVKTCNCKKVLIVDDLAFNLLAVELMLKKKFNIIPDKAFSGDESIIKVKQKLMSPCCKSYSLILMDYYMPPGMNGAEASLKIKQILKHNHQKSYIA